MKCKPGILVEHLTPVIKHDGGGAAEVCLKLDNDHKTKISSTAANLQQTCWEIKESRWRNDPNDQNAAMESCASMNPCKPQWTAAILWRRMGWNSSATMWEADKIKQKAVTSSYCSYRRIYLLNPGPYWVSNRVLWPLSFSHNCNLHRVNEAHVKTIKVEAMKNMSGMTLSLALGWPHSQFFAECVNIFALAELVPVPCQNSIFSVVKANSSSKLYELHI